METLDWGRKWFVKISHTAIHGVLLSHLDWGPLLLPGIVRLQKWMCRAVGPSLATTLEPLVYCPNVTSSSLFYRCYFLRCSSELAQLVQVKSLFCVDLIVIVIDCMIFLSPFLDVTSMSMSAVSFLSDLDSGLLCH